MARRTATRRRSSLRSVGTLLINPRKKRRTVKRRSNPRKRASTRKRTTTRKRRSTARRRSANPTVRRHRRKARGSKRTVKPYYRRRARARRRKNPTKRRKAPRVVRRRSRKNPSSRRRNPAFVQNLAAQARKIPVIGAALAHVVSFAPHAALGAVAVEAPIMGAKWIAAQTWVPQFIKDMGQPAYFAIIGAVLGLGAMYLWPGSVETKKRVAIAVASGCAGAAYYQWRTGAEAGDVQGFGAVMLSGVGPYGAVGMDYGAVGIGPDYGAVSLAGYGRGPAYTVDSGWGAVAIGS